MSSIITLLHPSRGRAAKARTTYDYWIKAATNPKHIEHVLSIDIDDGDFVNYHNAFGSKSVIVKGRNSNVVMAVNRAMNYTKGDIIIYLSDDFLCPPQWDTLVREQFENDNGQPMLIKVDDCLQPFDRDVLTIPIMNRALYNKLGYFWHPAYGSMFVDQDLYHTANNLNCLVMCPDLKFEHQHYSVRKAERDETYKRSDAYWNQGKKLYAQRMLKGFPLEK